MTSYYYSKAALEAYAFYQAVKIIDFDNIEYIGWLVPRQGEYVLLPLNDIWNTYTLKRSRIKKIYHLTNNQLIPKEVLD